MRISGGQLGGRVVRVPKNGVRPAQDRVREAVFSSLGEQIVGTRVLDLFAGSGAYGLEAWSRGAAAVCWVESDRQVVRVLQENIATLCGKTAPGVLRVVGQDVWLYLERGGYGLFDLVIADPPYERDNDELPEKVLIGLEKATILRSGGLLVFEQDAKAAVVERSGWVLCRNKAYGKSRVLIYRNENEPGGS